MLRAIGDEKRWLFISSVGRNFGSNRVIEVVVANVDHSARVLLIGGEEVLDALDAFVALERAVVDSREEGENRIDGVLVAAVLILE